MNDALRMSLAAAVLAAAPAQALATDAIAVRIQNTSPSAQVPMGLSVTSLPGESMSGVGGGCPASYTAPPASDAVVCNLTTNVEVFTLRSGFTLTAANGSGLQLWSAAYWVVDPALGPVWAWPTDQPLPPNEEILTIQNADGLQAEPPFSQASFTSTGSSQYELLLVLPATPVTVRGGTVRAMGQGDARVAIACHGTAACRLGPMRLTAAVPSPAMRRAAGTEAAPVRRSVVAVSRGNVTIPAGRTAVVRMRMPPGPRLAFSRAGTLRTQARLATTGRGGGAGDRLDHTVILRFTR